MSYQFVESADVLLYTIGGTGNYFVFTNTSDFTIADTTDFDIDEE